MVRATDFSLTKPEASEGFSFKEATCSNFWITEWDQGEEGQRQGKKLKK